MSGIERVRTVEMNERWVMSPKNRASGIVSFSLVLGLLLLPPSSAWPQTVSATVGVGSPPSSVAVNGVTNKIYVATCTTGSSTNGTVTAIDGNTDTTTTVTAGVCPWAVAVNPATNKIYVANHGHVSLICGSCISYGSVTVIDGTTNSTTTIIDPNAKFPQAVAVNPVTNKIYVANWSSNITVIDGATNSITTLSDPNAGDPIAVAMNSVTNKIYVANYLSNNVTVVDGGTNSISTVTDPNAIAPDSVAVNSVTNTIYVANEGNYPTANHGNVTKIDGSTNSTATITDPNAIAPGAYSRGFAVAVNSVTNKTYVTNFNDLALKVNGGVDVIDGVSNAFTTVTDPNAIAPIAVAVDSATNIIYVANAGCFLENNGCSNNAGGVTVIDGATDSITTIVDPNANAPIALAINPVTHTIYVANYLSNNVTVISGPNTSNFTLSVTGAGNGGGSVTSNPPGINCGSSCSASFASGTTVTLSASANATSNFTGWSGACSDTGACSIAMNAAASATATFTLQDFSLNPASTKLTLQPGGQGTDVITLAGVNDPFGSAIQLTCGITGPAPPPSCVFSATSVTPGLNSVTSTLTITAPARAAAVQPPSTQRQLSKLLYALWLPFMFGITLVGGSRKLRSGHRAVCGLLVLSLFLQTACGGGTSSSGSNGTGTSAPTNYTVMVTGTSGTIQHTTQVGVTVQ
jgi:DNA-binding beta-propeller fold protein YncE